ncbi:MAG: ABC transporter permease [Mycoplasmataceae bacterium]|nr:ABC transporter permease [Mycoplasmataceae bacterium]
MSIFGCIFKSVGAVQCVSMMIMMPPTFLSSTFVPAETMIPIMKGITNINPISHLVDASRQLLDYCTIDANFGWTFLCVSVIFIIFAPLTMRAYWKKTK